mmetsp:Transcript_15700/g.53234  ORF Transcript_15700/g.53234 Transcript_15700/m.53234 type:complete len:296 (+) Transcript_15700:655-1542(+)
MRRGKMPALITAWICSDVPAVMLEMVHTASLRMFFLLCSSMLCSDCSALRLMICCVCTSSPVTMLPTVRSAGVCTPATCMVRSSTRRRATPVLSTAWMRSLGPSEMYDSAQHASVTVSMSVRSTSCARSGSAACTALRSGGGLPRHRFDRVHVALRMVESRGAAPPCEKMRSSAGSAPCSSTRSRHATESPATLPRAHAACSRTSSLGAERRRTKMGTAFASITTRVCSVVPEAMLVSAHAASNCSCGFSSRWRNCTKRGTTCASITCWMGGERSMDSTRRNCVVARNCTAGSGE